MLYTDDFKLQKQDRLVPDVWTFLMPGKSIKYFLHYNFKELLKTQWTVISDKHGQGWSMSHMYVFVVLARKISKRIISTNTLYTYSLDRRKHAPKWQSFFFRLIKFKFWVVRFLRLIVSLLTRFIWFLFNCTFYFLKLIKVYSFWKLKVLLRV